MNNYLENLAISKKFSLLLIVTALFVAAILGVLCSAINDGLKAKKITNDISEYISVLNDLQLTLDQIHGGLLISLIHQKENQKLATPLPQGYSTSREKLLHLADQVNEKAKLATSPDSLWLSLADLKDKMIKAVAYSDSYFEFVSQQQTGEDDSLYTGSSSIVFNRFIPLYVNLSTAIGELKETKLALQGSITGDNDSAVTFKGTLVLCLFLIGAAFVLVYTRVLGNVTSQAVRDTQKILEALSLGEIPKVNSSSAKDEFGAMQNGLKKLVANLESIRNFISKIGRGEFDIQEVIFENKGDLSTALWQMRDSLSRVKDEEQKMNWTNDGLTKFSELVRTHQHNVEDLANQSMRFLCKYIDAQQGSFFIHEKASVEGHLILKACFAFDKKKYYEKQILIGDGVLGQAFLEANTVLMTDIPQGYVHITSGLGHAKPTCLAIIPLKFNGVMEGVIEVATFHKIQAYRIRFLERCGEFLASALQMAAISSNTNKLLKQSQQHTEEMKSQEEEMRQNMEEMASTQEELQRREKIQKEEIAHLNALHEQNIATFKRLSLVADNTDNSVVITDADGKIEYVNKGFTNLTGYTLQEALGKKPGSFLQGKGTDPRTVARIRQQLKEHKALYEEILNYDKYGREYWISLAINPIIENGTLSNYISIQTNVTKTKLLAIDFTLQLEAIGKSNAVIEFDLDGIIKTANAKFLEVMGYTLEEIKGKHHRVFTLEKESSSATYRQMWQDLKAGKSLTGEFKRKNKQGGTVWLNGTYTSIVDLNNQPYKVIKFAQDITEQKMKALDFEGQANATDNTMASIEFSPEGNIVHANARFLNTMGYTLDEIKNQHHRMFVDERYANSDEYKKFWKDLACGLPQSGEFQRRGKEAKTVWLSATYTPIKDTEGKVYKVIKFAQDVTEQKIKALDFTSQLEAIGKTNALVEFDLEGNIKYANEKFLHIMGYTLEEITGKHHRLFVQEEDSHSSEYKEMWKKLGKGMSTSGVFRRKNKRGDELWLNGTYTSIVDLNGKPYRVIKFAQDVTEQRLKSLEVEGQANAIDNAIASIEFTKEGNIIYANSRFLNMMGYSLDEIKNKHHSLFVDDVYAKSETYKQFWYDLADGRPQSGEFKRAGKEGKVVWLSASYTPVKDVSGKVYKVIKLAHDITKQKLESIDFESQRQAIDKAYSVVEFDPYGTILNANSNFLQLMGYELPDIKGRHHRIFMQQDESYSEDYRAFWKMLSEGEFIQGKFPRVTKEGTVIQIQGTYFGVKDLSGKIFKVIKFAQQIDNNDHPRVVGKTRLTVI